MRCVSFLSFHVRLELLGLQRNCVWNMKFSHLLILLSPLPPLHNHLN